MERIMRKTICLLLLSSLILHPSSLLLADGGTVRLSQQQGNYQIAVLTTPTPLRAGPIDISVLVQKAGTHELVSEGASRPQTNAAGSPRQLNLSFGHSRGRDQQALSRGPFRAARVRLVGRGCLHRRPPRKGGRSH